MLCIDCPCYEIYRDEKAFEEGILNGKSYLGCLAYVSEKHSRQKSKLGTNRQNRIKHLCVPIMLGSYLDYCIRGDEMVEKSRAQWGAFIIKGMLKIYPSFSTFDALSMHVRETDGNRSIEWFTYVDGKGLASKYFNGILTWTYDRMTKTCTKTEDFYEWSNLLHRANPRFEESTFDRIPYESYQRMFDTILSFPYDINDLKNRQVLSGVAIMKKYIDSYLSRSEKQNAVNHQKLSEAFESGSMYSVLSKKSAYGTMDWCKSYPQNYDSTLHDGRSNIVEHLLPNVNRASNETLRNSKALSFPPDAINYYCPLNTKDLKAAGEQHTLADFTMMTEESNVKETLDYLKTISTNDHNHDRLILNGFEIDCFKDWSLKDLLDIKKFLPHVTTKYYRPYVIISTKAAILVKYNDDYDVYFSPAETLEFSIRYKEDALISTLAKELDPSGLKRTQPAKSTVAINNLKGSVANLTSDRFHLSLMRMTQGTTCYMISDEKICNNMLEAAVLSHGNDTANYYKRFNAAVKYFKLPCPSDDRNQIVEQAVLEKTDINRAIESLRKMYDLNRLMSENVSQPPVLKGAMGALSLPKKKPTTFIRVKVTERLKKAIAYLQMILAAKNYSAYRVWNARFWGVFGDQGGASVEDGIILDRKMVQIAPSVFYNACITVDFRFKTYKQPNQAVFVPVRESNTNFEGLSHFDRETFIGCLITETEVNVKNSRHCEIINAKIGNHYYYLVHFLLKRENTYGKVNVRCIRNDKVITIIISGIRETRIGVGSKLANSFGQKNICSLVTDLSDYWGITRDGRKVHAQIIYSDVSIIGRLASGQLYHMLTSPDLAIGPNGELIAPLNLVVHALNPYTNLKIFNVKVDTMTNVNGFDSQSLCATSHALRNERLLNKVLQVINMHGLEARVLDKEESEAYRGLILPSSHRRSDGAELKHSTSPFLAALVNQAHNFRYSAFRSADAVCIPSSLEN